MSNPTSLARKLAEVTGATGWIEKRGTAPDKIGGYKYAMAVDIYDAIRTELAKRNVAQTVGINGYQHDPKGDSILTTVTGDLTFIDAETGEVISVPFVGCGMDRGDKSVYKAITGGVRDALKATFLLPTGDDPEAEAPEHPEKSEARPKGPQPPRAEPVKTERVGLTNPQKAKLAATLRELGITSTDQRHMFILTATGKHKTDEMTQADFDKALAEATPGSQAVSNALAVA